MGRLALPTSAPAPSLKQPLLATQALNRLYITLPTTTRLPSPYPNPAPPSTTPQHSTPSAHPTSTNHHHVRNHRPNPLQTHLLRSPPLPRRLQIRHLRRRRRPLPRSGKLHRVLLDDSRYRAVPAWRRGQTGYWDGGEARGGGGGEGGGAL